MAGARGNKSAVRQRPRARVGADGLRTREARGLDAAEGPKGLRVREAAERTMKKNVGAQVGDGPCGARGAGGGRCDARAAEDASARARPQRAR